MRTTPEPHWMPDDSSYTCITCDALFTKTNRRHHCRRCGVLSCNTCLSRKRCRDTDKCDDNKWIYDTMHRVSIQQMIDEYGDPSEMEYQRVLVELENLRLELDNTRAQVQTQKLYIKQLEGIVEEKNLMLSEYMSLLQEKDEFESKYGIEMHEVHDEVKNVPVDEDDTRNVDLLLELDYTRAEMRVHQLFVKQLACIVRENLHVLIPSAFVEPFSMTDEKDAQEASFSFNEDAQEPVFVSDFDELALLFLRVLFCDQYSPCQDFNDGALEVVRFLYDNEEDIPTVDPVFVEMRFQFDLLKEQLQRQQHNPSEEMSFQRKRKTKVCVDYVVRKRRKISPGEEEIRDQNWTRQHKEDIRQKKIDEYWKRRQQASYENSWERDQQRTSHFDQQKGEEKTTKNVYNDDADWEADFNAEREEFEKFFMLNEEQPQEAKFIPLEENPESFERRKRDEFRLFYLEEFKALSLEGILDKLDSARVLPRNRKGILRIMKDNHPDRLKNVDRIIKWEKEELFKILNDLKEHIDETP
jgi:hypothetical protein